MTVPRRVQSYLRRSAQRCRRIVHHPPFTLYFHSSSNLPADSFAIPDRQIGTDELDLSLTTVYDEFQAQQRSACYRFLDEFAPRLAHALQSAGFREISRERVLVCTPGTFRPAPLNAEISMVTLDAASPLELVRLSLVTNERGFDPEFAGVVSVEEAIAYRGGLTAARAFLAYVNDAPAGAGMFDPPVERVTEISGITTVQQWRRRGVASLLTSCAVSVAFNQGVEIVIARTGNEAARRVYERIGFGIVGAELLFAETA